jgi:aminoglycoside phosphotransferase (APT) family kinase protein
VTIDVTDANEPQDHSVEGVDAAPVTEWIQAHAPAVSPPLDFELITGGHSNLTFRVTDTAGRRWVLRRPPLAQVLATAHDMGREHRIISALAPTDVPVAPTIGLCTDDAVNGAPFYVMDFVDGLVVRDASIAEGLTREVRRTASESIVDVLAHIHRVDLDAVGLSDLGRHDSYIERQLKRWYGQFEKSKTREVPELDQVYAELSARVPEQGAATIVHGDYRLDNCMVAPDGSIMAVLDWELCTLGDPLADLGLLMVYWTDPDDPSPAGISGATALDGFLRRSELLERYAATSGRDLSAIDYYVAFGYWKLACIIEGVYARYRGGAMGHRGGERDFDFFGAQVLSLVESAREAIGRLT